MDLFVASRAAWNHPPIPTEAHFHNVASTECSSDKEYQLRRTSSYVCDTSSIHFLSGAWARLLIPCLAECTVGRNPMWRWCDGMVREQDQIMGSFQALTPQGSVGWSCRVSKLYWTRGRVYCHSCAITFYQCLCDHDIDHVDDKSYQVFQDWYVISQKHESSHAKVRLALDSIQR